MNRLIPIQATLQTLNAHLLESESILLIQDGVGLYDGKERDLKFDNGTLHLTTHRIIYLDQTSPTKSSLTLDLNLIIGTEFWSGFMIKSSPKITCVLRPLAPSTEVSNSRGSIGGGSNGNLDSTPSSTSGSSSSNSDERNWVCRVCGMKNSTSNQCTLCGVARDLKSTTINSNSTTRIQQVRDLDESSSGPSSRNSSSNSNSTPTPPPISIVVDESGKLACPTCTYLNHRSMSRCELCDSPLLTSSSSTSSSIKNNNNNNTYNTSISSQPPSRPGTPKDSNSFIRLSFRKGGEKLFYSTLKNSLENSTWEIKNVSIGKKKELGGGNGVGGGGGGGIQSIMRGIGEETKGREDELDDALKDLNSLMAKAKETINLAQLINDRISSQESKADPSSSSTTTVAETNLVRNSLSTLGLTTTIVTPDLLLKEQKLHEELAKELKVVLEQKGGVMKDGVVALDQVWCVWNRARGVSLISPKDLRLVVPCLARLTPKFTLRTFTSSGLTVFHTSHFNPPVFKRRLLDSIDLNYALNTSTLDETITGQGENLLNIRGDSMGVTIIDLAREEGVGISLILEMVEELEEATGEIVRDDQGGSLRFHRNFFV